MEVGFWYSTPSCPWTSDVYMEYRSPWAEDVQKLMQMKAEQASSVAAWLDQELDQRLDQKRCQRLDQEPEKAFPHYEARACWLLMWVWPFSSAPQ
mmetsp:Transcript_18167/g.42472  ORF Transcript_18167/g.42472 Transcript_18167/m.42472 type:complete len:95 (+) Transcript_18167:2673-2957(+)